MRLLKIKVKGLFLLNDEIELDFFTEQRVNSENSEMVYNTFNNICTNNVISLVGINASGKTTMLKMISFILKMLNGESINSIEYHECLSKQNINELEIIFTDEKEKVYKLNTSINYIKENDIEGRYIIDKEKIYSKNITQIRSKKDMVTFTDSNIYRIRDNNEEFLKDDISIIIAINKKHLFKNMDLLNLTNINLLGIIGEFPKELFEFLDPNIKDIKYDSNNKMFILEFYGRQPIELTNPLQFEHYLSSGTIKGLTVFMNALIAFNESGYLIIDEIENHFNREIVATLIRFFMNKRVNKKGATLIFSTHYSELLDEFDRNDSIYIVRNKNGITLQKLYEILKRNDIKKSDAFKSDYLDGTVPSYNAYINLKKAIINKKRVINNKEYI